jgi:hypothetical protein
VPVLVYPDVRAAVAWSEPAFGFAERVRIGEAAGFAASFVFFAFLVCVVAPLAARIAQVLVRR